MPKSLICDNNPELYDRVVDANKHLSEMNRIIIEFVLAHAGQNPSKYVVDIGAGTGLLSLPMARAIAPTNVIALEPTKKFCEHLTKKARNVSNLSVFCHERIPQNKPEHQIDIITLRLTYHHIPDEQKLGLLEYINTLLVPGGYIIFGEAIIASYDTQDERRAADRRYHDYRIELARKSDDEKYLAEQIRAAETNECPHKVSLDVLKDQISQVGFKSIKTITVETKEAIDHDKLGYKVVIAQLAKVGL